MKSQISINELRNSNHEFKHEINELYSNAFQYLNDFSWCSQVLEGWYDRGIADILAVFYFKILPSKNADEFVWVVVGDLPPAYIDIESAPNGACAIKAYIEIMEDWVLAVKTKKNLDDVFPINVPANDKYANMLASRINFIRENFLMLFSEELKDC